jgi:hypothetical protein
LRHLDIPRSGAGDACVQTLTEVVQELPYLNEVIADEFTCGRKNGDKDWAHLLKALQKKAKPSTIEQRVEFTRDYFRREGDFLDIANDIYIPEDIGDGGPDHDGRSDG